MAIQTISHNISNVNTPGYSRQRVLFTTEQADFDGRFYVGRGVKVVGVERMRDEFLEAQVPGGNPVVKAKRTSRWRRINWPRTSCPNPATTGSRRK